MEAYISKATENVIIIDKLYFKHDRKIYICCVWGVLAVGRVGEKENEMKLLWFYDGIEKRDVGLAWPEGTPGKATMELIMNSSRAAI